MFIFLTASSAYGRDNIIRRGDSTPRTFDVIVTGNPKIQRKYDEAFTKDIQREGDDIFKDLSKNLEPYSPELAVRIDKIRKKIPGITFSKGQRIVTSGANMSCMMTDASTWMVQPGKKPHITISTNLHEDLFVHEVISVAGIVDDEYQVTGPLLGARDLIDAGELTPELAEVLLGAVDMQTRKGTPKYKINLNKELCYDHNGQLIPAGKGGDGTATGVGGGGNMTALEFKKIILAWAPAWWKKTHGDKPLSAAFLQRLTTLGVEPMVEHQHLVQTFPVQQQFTFSKRTKKLIVRLKLEILEEPQYLGHATNTIYRHIFEELNSKKPFNYQDCVYGVELARNLGVINEATFDKYFTNEDSEPGRVKKFYRR